MSANLLLACNGENGTPVVDLTQGLVYHALLNNNADDIAGTYNGIPFNGVDFQGDVAKLDGIDDYITTDYLLTQNQTRTYSFWYRPTISQDTNIRVCFGFGPMVFSASHSSFDYSGALAIRDNLDVWRSTGNYTLTVGTLYNIVCVINNTTAKLYINGANVGSTITFSGQYSTKATEYYRNKLDLGSSRNASLVYTSFLNGTMSNFRIYNEAKNQAFIDALYVEGYYPKLLPLPTTVGLQAYYPLTGTAEDKVGGYNGIEASGISYVDDAEFGSAAYFDGVDDHILVTKTNDNNVGTINFSVKAADTITTNVVWSYYNDRTVNTTVQYFYCRIYQGYLELLATNNVSVYILRANTTVLSNDTWYNCSIWSNGTTISMSINGVVQTVNATSGVNNGAWIGNLVYVNKFGIGRLYTSGSNYYLGVKNMRGLREYNRVLTTQENTDIYNYENNFRFLDIDDGLQAYYPLANNSLDNYRNEYDCTDTSISFDGLSAQFTGTSNSKMVTTLKINATDTVDIPFTLSLWYKRTGNAVNGSAVVATDRHPLVCIEDDVSRFSFILSASMADNKMYLQVAKGATANGSFIWENISVPAGINLNTNFHKYEVKYDGSKTSGGFSILIDGIKLTLPSPTVTGTYSGMDTDFVKFGSALNWTSTYYMRATGKMSKARIYKSKVLTQEQSDILFNTEKGDFGL